MLVIEVSVQSVLLGHFVSEPLFPFLMLLVVHEEILKWEEFGISYIRLEVLTLMNIEITDIIPCSLVDWYQCFGEQFGSYKDGGRLVSLKRRYKSTMLQKTVTSVYIS
jgi:hypothetical protein